MSFDRRCSKMAWFYEESQSLSSRAMSFDIYGFNQEHLISAVSIPFEQGDVFRRSMVLPVLTFITVSIPFEQGNVFRQTITRNWSKKRSLNPFRAGQCLSTDWYRLFWCPWIVSIPFEQGNVFRLIYVSETNDIKTSQSLSSRAMSFDWRTTMNSENFDLSQSLSSRAMSFDIKWIWFHSICWRSQSLSSRAMSFDTLITTQFIQQTSQSLSSRAMSFDFIIL